MISFFFLACMNSPTPKWEKLFQDSLQTLELPPPQEEANVLVTVLPTEERLSMQYFPQEEVFYLSLDNYLWLDDAKSTAAATLTITQIAVLNYEILGAKIQLNPKSGAIILASEIDANQMNQAILSRNIERLLRLSETLRPRFHAAQGTNAP